MRRLLPSLLVTAVVLACPRPSAAHPVPFSYLDLRLNARGVAGALVVHNYDAAYDLGDLPLDALLDRAVVAQQSFALIELLKPRLTLLLDGHPETLTWGAVDALPERQSVRLNFTANAKRPARLQVRALLFPYDPAHQTFINIYEDDALKRQAVLDVERQTADYDSTDALGRHAVVRTFVLSGIQHILIGPDHILFLVGLLLLRGSIARLAGIATAFTIGHSITLSLAALDLFSPPPRLVEPLIALSIVIVGADNLLVLRGPADGTQRSTDIRAWLASGFGLIHGFGFASVLKEFGLPQAALGWSLFAFNLGVEVGQLLIVTIVAGSLAFLARRSALWAARVARSGSVAVILAGLFWFVERTFPPGGF